MPAPAVRTAAVLAWLAVASVARAQSLPSEPVTFAGGRVVVGGDVAATVGPEDEGYFNYSDYEYSTRREFRLGLNALVRVNERLSFLGELRAQNVDRIIPFAAYARLRPFPRRRLDIQIGRVPPTFGSLSRQAYGHDNPLIGYPIAYQYFTSLRADALPATTEELLRMRGRGWLASYSIGNTAAEPGLPLVSAFTWDTGVQVTGGWEAVMLTGSVTTGTASDPRVRDNNGGKQLAGRARITPAAGLAIGASAARGPFLDRDLFAPGEPDRSGALTQQAFGLDAEYSRDHWLVRVDTALSRWDHPIGAATAPATRLRAVATTVEGRYAVLPGAYVAARLEHIGFNSLLTATGRQAWDAPVTRTEVGGGYLLQRNLLAKVSVQVNRRDDGRVRASTLLAGQLQFWF